MRSSRFALISAIAVLSMLGLTSKNSRAASARDKVYEDKDSGFRLSAPEAWEKRQTKETLLKMVFTVDGAPSGAATTPTFEVSVISKSTLTDDRLMQAVDAFRDSDSKDHGTVGTNEDLTIDGVKAVRYAYGRKGDGVEVKGFRVIAIHNHRMYEFHFAADPATYEAKSAETQKVVDSVKWIE